MDPKLQAIHFLSILTLFFLCVAPSYQQVCNHQDQSALLTFNSSISFSLFEPLNWSYTSSCCQWEGVSCDANGSVTRLQLSYMGLVGVIASSIGDLTSLTHLNLSNNLLGGSLTDGIVRLTNLRVMDLSSNSISGPIPLQIGNLYGLYFLNLTSNYFSGSIPATISNLKNLELLDLSYNNLTGAIPASLESLAELFVFNVSYNNLQGRVLTTGQFATFDELSYQGNPGLCGFFGRTNHPCYVQLASPDNKPSLLDGFYVGLASGFSGVLAVVAPYIWVQIWKQNR